jgi:hypothetical protein
MAITHARFIKRKQRDARKKPEEAENVIGE